jgi:hypothetical protein
MSWHCATSYLVHRLPPGLHPAVDRFPAGPLRQERADHHGAEDQAEEIPFDKVGKAL